MIETPVEDRKRSKTLVIVIVLFACLGGLCLIGVIGYVGYSYLGSSTAFGLGATPESAVLIVPPGDDPAADPTTAPIDENIPSGDLQALIEDGSVTVEGIPVTPNALLARPPQPDFKVNNPGPKDLSIGVACGLVLMPPVETEAKLMVYQKAEAIVPAGGSANIELMVVSIEASKTITGTGDYTVGTMVEGELLTLAKCLCGQDVKAQAQIDENWYSEVLFATWSVSDNYPISLMMENMGLYTAFTGGTPSCLETVFPKSLSILDTCGITVGDPRTGTAPPPTPTP